MFIDYNKVRVRIHLDRLRSNYDILASLAGPVMPVVKADAYGHGLIRVADALADRGAESFAVGTVEEGVKLRRSGRGERIVSLLGPIDAHEYEPLWEEGIVPFIGNFEQLSRLVDTAKTRPTPLEIILKFDTGMSRLGFSLSETGEVARVLAKAPGVRPVWAASHLATADEPDKAEYVRLQHGKLEQILARMADAGYDLKVSLANSGGILGHGFTHGDLQRAGIALYGVNPFAGTEFQEPGRMLAPAMEVTAPVVQVRDLPAGASVSYGCTFTADADMRIAIVAAGYADCYSRGLTGEGQMCLKGGRARILGRVCMQLTAVDITGRDDVRVGDVAHLLGGQGAGAVTPEDLAGWWGTITYEVFCLLGLNRKEYVEE